MIPLYLTVVFYTLGATTLFNLVKPELVHAVDFVKALFPFAFNHYWYFTAYFCLFFFIPFLNHTIHTLERKAAGWLVVTIVILLAVLPTVFNTDMFHVDTGYSALWLGALYLIGAYIKKWGWGAHRPRWLWLLLYFGSVCFTWLSRIAAEIITPRLLGGMAYQKLLIAYNSPTILLAGVSLLMFFAGRTFPKGMQKGIAFFSPLAFSVYLIHVEPLVWKYIMKDAFVAVADYPVMLLVPAVLILAVVIWLLCSLLDLPRYWLFRLLRIKSLCTKLENRFQR